MASRIVGSPRLRPTDLLRLAAIGLKSRIVRTTLTVVGIAIGVGSIVAIIGISASSRGQVLDQLDRLGTNLLAAQSSQSMFSGEDSGLPSSTGARLERIPAIEQQAIVYNLEVPVGRNDLMPAGRNGGVTSGAADPGLAETLTATQAAGRFLTDSDSNLPVAVLGSAASERLGITTLEHRPSVVIGEHQFAVVGLLDPLPLHPDLDRMVLISPEVATRLYDADLHTGTVFFRVDGRYVEQVASLAARIIKPQSPDSISVTRPTEALEVQASVDKALSNLLLGLGSVALLVGAIGIANVMAIAATERRVEIGVRRAIGGTRLHIALQFVSESAMLAGLGGLLGVVFGMALVAAYSFYRGWLLAVPTAELGLVTAGALAVGAISGLYPALRASQLDPAEAVRSRI